MLMIGPTVPHEPTGKERVDAGMEAELAAGAGTIAAALTGQQRAEERPDNTYEDGGFVFLSSGDDEARCSSADVLHAWRSSGVYASTRALKNGKATIQLSSGARGAAVTVPVADLYRSVQEMVHAEQGYGEDYSTWKKVWCSSCMWSCTELHCRPSARACTIASLCCGIVWL